MSEGTPLQTYNVLFLCTGNSARSILAEALLNRMGEGRFRAYSAGSHPTGRVNPHALSLLGQHGFGTSGFRSKDWSEFSRPGAPPLDFVFTVCDRAAAETCPVWPGQPMTAHWGVADPAAVTGDPKAIEAAFREAFITLRRRIELFVSLPVASLDRMSLQRRLAEIGTARAEKTTT